MGSSVCIQNAVGMGEFVDLFEFIDPSEVECMNQAQDHPWQHMLKAGDDPSYCESNTDDQLILNFGFREKVKVYSMSVKGLEGREDSAPLNLRVYVNKERWS